MHLLITTYVLPIKRERESNPLHSSFPGSFLAQKIKDVKFIYLANRLPTSEICVTFRSEVPKSMCDQYCSTTT